MKKNKYLPLALVACLGIASVFLLEEALAASGHPDNSTMPAEFNATHSKAAAHKKAMMQHYKTLMDEEYEKGGHEVLKLQYETMAIHHADLENSASIDAKRAKPK